MVDQNYISKMDMENALSDDVYDRIQNVNTAAKETNSHYSYFTDELIEQVTEALSKKLGYTESQEMCIRDRYGTWQSQRSE